MSVNFYSFFFNSRRLKLLEISPPCGANFLGYLTPFRNFALPSQLLLKIQKSQKRLQEINLNVTKYNYTLQATFKLLASGGVYEGHKRSN